jgi:hypothetical protein
VPELHVSEALAWAGVSVPEHEKPMTETAHWTVVSSVQVLDDAT